MILMPSRSPHYSGIHTEDALHSAMHFTRLQISKLFSRNTEGNSTAYFLYMEPKFNNHCLGSRRQRDVLCRKKNCFVEFRQS
jgi:hypothetical protein